MRVYTDGALAGFDVRREGVRREGRRRSRLREAYGDAGDARAVSAPGDASSRVFDLDLRRRIREFRVLRVGIGEGGEARGFGGCPRGVADADGAHRLDVSEHGAALADVRRRVDVVDVGDAPASDDVDASDAPASDDVDASDADAPASYEDEIIMDTLGTPAYSLFTPGV